MRRYIIFLALAGSLCAQSPGVSVRIETETGQTQFRIGETIGLTLTFDRTLPDSAPPVRIWSIQGRERSVLGLENDGFPVSPPAGTSDPMRYRFGQAWSYSGPGGMLLREKTT